MTKFAAVGISHDHIYGMTSALLHAGGELAGFHEPDDALAAAYAGRFGAPRAADARVLLDDPGIALILSSTVSADRTPVALQAMRAGKDVMLDKPGAVSRAQLDVLRRTQVDTGRIVSICYSEHHESRATVHALDLVRAGAIGRVVNTAGFGPHRLREPTRPAWFFERARYGGILCDIASHQCWQFLVFSGAGDAAVLSATVANRATPHRPELQDMGDIHLRAADGTTGYVRVDWFTPDGMPVWGDVRLTVCGSEGTIELRKNVDPAGRPGGDHLFLADRQGVRHIDCSGFDLPYGRRLLADVRDRTETAMQQALCFKAMELAITAQETAEAQAWRAPA